MALIYIKIFLKREHVEKSCLFFSKSLMIIPGYNELKRGRLAN